ncbi:hypothetical protein RUND412_005188 [Rhizina undulata]
MSNPTTLDRPIKTFVLHERTDYISVHHSFGCNIQWLTLVGGAQGENKIALKNDRGRILYEIEQDGGAGKCVFRISGDSECEEGYFELTQETFLGSPMSIFRDSCWVLLYYPGTRELCGRSTFEYLVAWRKPREVMRFVKGKEWVQNGAGGEPVVIGKELECGTSVLLETCALMDLEIEDLLVTAWVAKLWMDIKRSLRETNGKNGSNWSVCTVQ